jgi:hypothetical protein
MTDLNTLTSKELKELAKQAKVQNWWNLKKVDLIEALTPPEPETPRPKRRKKAPVDPSPDKAVCLKEVIKELNITPYKARKTLRKHLGQCDGRWSWVEGSEELKKVQSILGVQ